MFLGAVFETKTILCKIMIQTPKITILGYYSGLKRVNKRDKADLVQIELRRDRTFNTYHLHKKDYNGDRTYQKPVKHWDELPETI